MRRVSASLWVVLGVVCLPAMHALAAPSLGDFAQVEKLQATLATVAEAVSPTVVAIRAERRVSAAEWAISGQPLDASEDPASHQPLTEKRIPAVGTGVIIEAAGAILTNEHVVRDAEPEDITCILSSGEIYSVKSITTDPRSDLAIVRIDARNLPQARLGDLVNVKQGHFAIVLGNPLGTASEDRGRPSMSFGVISALGRPLTRQLDPTLERYYGNLIQTDARINQGNSGGPLLNLRGEVVGIVAATSTPSGNSDGVGYAIPIDRRTKNIIAQLLKGKQIEYGFIGVQLEEPTDEERKITGVPAGASGAVIREVQEGTPAETAQLKAGDVITEFDGMPVHDSDELIRMVGSAQVGATVSVVYYRDGARHAARITPTHRDVPPGVHMETPVTWRGVTVSELTPGLREQYQVKSQVQGVLITSVREDTLANAPENVRKAIRVGSVIEEVNGRPVRSLREFNESTSVVRGAIQLTVWADGQTVEIGVAATSTGE